MTDVESGPLVLLDNNYWRSVVGYVVNFGDWLTDILNDPDAAEILREDLGLPTGALPPVALPEPATTDLRDFANGQQSISVESSLNSLGELVDGIEDAVRTMLPGSPTDYETWTWILQLVGIHLAIQLERDHPVANAIIRALGLFTDKFGTVNGLSLGSVLSLFAKPPVPSENYQDGHAFDEHAATITSDLVVFVVQQVFLSAMAHKMHDREDWFDSYYGWDTPPLHEGRADTKVMERMYTMVFRESVNVGPGIIGGSLTLTVALVPSEHGGPGLFMSLGGGEFTTTQPVGNRVLTLDVAVANPVAFYLNFVDPAADLDFEGASMSVRLDPSPELAGSPQPWFDYSDGAVFLRLEHAAVDLGIGEGGQFGINLGTRAHLGIRKSASSLLDKLFDRDIEVSFDLDVGWGRTNGLGVKDGSGMQGRRAPASNNNRFFRLHDIMFGVQPTGPDFIGLEAFFITSASLDLGPLKATVEQFGARQAAMLADGGGDFQTGFLTPKGIALSIDTAGFKGGGYLFIDPERNEYAGVLAFTFGKFSLKAIGILTTEVPGRDESWAFIGLFMFEFPPWGPLSGVGGIIGYHHGLSIPALQSGLRTGTLDSILFPEDPTSNPAQIINHVRAVFPITPDAVTVGIMLQFSMLAGKIQAIIGLLLQWDNATSGSEGDASLTRLSVIGRLQIIVPADSAEPRIKILLDVAGSYDFPAGLLSVDGALRDSKIGRLTLTGSGSVRRQARRSADNDAGLPAAQPSQIITVGGWHPRFKDVPAGLPKQDRVGFSIKSAAGASTKYELSCMAYYASTPNTTQIGLEATAMAKKWGFTLTGRFSFDGIWFENPDYFELDIEFESTLKKGNKTWAKIDLDVYLRGSGHWIFKGKATIKVFFISKSINIHEEWGTPLPPVLESFPVEDALAEAVRDLRNWTPELPEASEMLVSLRNPGADGEILAHPMGDLAFSQNVVPLGVTIERFGAYVPGGADRFDIDEVILVGGDGDPEATTPLTDYFSPGEYLELTPEEKLTTPSFESFRSGVKVAVSEHAMPSFRVSATPNYELKYRGRDLPAVELTPTYGGAAAAAHVAAAGRSDVGRNRFTGAAPRNQVGISEPPVVTTDQTLTPIAAAPAATFTEARQAMTDQDQLLVEAHELETAQ